MCLMYLYVGVYVKTKVNGQHGPSSPKIFGQS